MHINKNEYNESQLKEKLKTNAKILEEKSRNFYWEKERNK